MTDDTLKNALRAQEANSNIQRLIADADRTRNLMRSVLEPAEDLRRSLLYDTTPNLVSELEGIRNFGVELENQFRLPTLPETPTLFRALDEMDETARAFAHYRDHTADLRHAVEAMTTPWLDTQDLFRSLTGFVDLQEIGHVLSTLPAFDLDPAQRLRSHLGDWRETIDWSADLFVDPLARSDFYVERGFDPALTDFPASAFYEAITIAGIKRNPPPFLDAYARPREPEQDEEQAGFERNNAAHDRLQRFESQIRAFIDQKMTAALGEKWIKHRVSGQTRQEWYDKREKAREEGHSGKSLIAYADFTDYEKIIVQKDNWQEVFAPIFRRKTLVQESFQRLYPIRVCTMHSRIITQDDEIFLHAETHRLLKTMGIKP